MHSLSSLRKGLQHQLEVLTLHSKQMVLNEADGRCLRFRDKEVQGTCLGMRDKEVQGTCLGMRDKEVKGYMSRNACHRLECGQVGLSTYLGNKFLSYILTYWCNCSATIKSSFSF